MPDDSPGIRVLCPTRWTVRAEALHSILANYEVVQSLLEESIDCVRDTEMRSRIQGISACMTTFDFFFGVSLGELLLNHSDNLSRALQASSISAAEGQKIANMTVKTLQAIRTDNLMNLNCFGYLLARKRKMLKLMSLPFLGDESNQEGMMIVYMQMMAMLHSVQKICIDVHILKHLI
eukprot:Em0001g3123a